MKTWEVTKEDFELVQMAKDVLEKNYEDGVYRHTVGSAIRCKNKKVYLGVNCDGIHGSCGEFIAMGAAITAGERDFETVVAVQMPEPHRLVAPCGNCRQMLFDYCPDIRVLLLDEKGELVKVGIKDLLPLAYECRY